MNIRPGKPTFAGMLDTIPLIGLPGNPVSAYVCAQLFVIPFMLHLTLNKRLFLKHSWAKLKRDLPRNGVRQHFMRARIVKKNCGLVVSPNQRQDSSLVDVLSKSNCLIVRPPNERAKDKGEMVKIIKLL